MIRDPSDGSVKEIPTWEEKVVADGLRVAIELSNLIIKQSNERMGFPPLPEEPASGLPFGSTKPETIAQLEKSRAQLKRYHETGVWDDGNL